MSSRFMRSAVFALLGGSSLLAAAQPVPESRTNNFRETFHGQELIDPFHWLEDSGSAETRKWIDAQNKYAHALLDLRPVRRQIANRLTEMEAHDHIGAPSLRNGFYYFERRGASEDLWSYDRRSVS